MSARVMARGVCDTPGRYGSAEADSSGQLPSGSG
ncbi:Uncharacterised protein [Bordetella pertussis]|nr:Uncharacterised protein [Bordetella pertussis]CFP01402.1 Uncharacterised protein [Bordetella pertussis]CFP24040.1 Uncharacterised protein [Bordetella pertussis]CFW56585.1 Uncharacterised protein [Bordetella pertussis]CPI41577.1 Uncharacterised protein [Bordetella pertussis]